MPTGGPPNRAPSGALRGPGAGCRRKQGGIYAGRCWCCDEESSVTFTGSESEYFGRNGLLDRGKAHEVSIDLCRRHGDKFLRLAYGFRASEKIEFVQKDTASYVGWSVRRHNDFYLLICRVVARDVSLDD